MNLPITLACQPWNKPMNFFLLPNIKFGQNLSENSRDIWHAKTSYDLENGVKITKIYCLSTVKLVQMIFGKSQFVQKIYNFQDPVVQSIISLTSSLRGQLVLNKLVKRSTRYVCYNFITKYTRIFFWKNERSFCNAKACHLFLTKKILVYLRYQLFKF